MQVFQKVFPLRLVRVASRRAKPLRQSIAPSPSPSPSPSPARKCYSSFGPQPSYRDRAALGVFTPKAAVLFVAAGIGLYFYFQHEKAKLLQERQKEREAKQVGRAHVGGPFTLTTHENKPFSEQDLLGKWNMLYFGFTNCPDICPAELDKMGAILDILEKEYGTIFQPTFISVDPARDNPTQIAQYLADFHPRFTGLTGPYPDIKSTCKAFRVYFSTPPPPPDADPNANADPDAKGDYLVDHSIYVYLMDPRGEFVEAFGQSATVDEVVCRVRKEIGLWEEANGKRV